MSGAQRESIKNLRYTEVLWAGPLRWELVLWGGCLSPSPVHWPWHNLHSLLVCVSFWLLAKICWEISFQVFIMISYVAIISFGIRFWKWFWEILSEVSSYIFDDLALCRSAKFFRCFSNIPPRSKKILSATNDKIWYWKLENFLGMRSSFTARSTHGRAHICPHISR